MSISNPTSIKVQSKDLPRISSKLMGKIKLPKNSSFSLSKTKVPKGASTSTPNFAKMTKIKIPKVTKISIIKKSIKKVKLPAY